MDDKAAMWRRHRQAVARCASAWGDTAKARCHHQAHPRRVGLLLQQVLQKFRLRFHC